MIRFMWKFMVFLVLVPALILQGCTIENDEDGDVIVIGDSPPAAPRGVYSISGNEEVTVNWFPNQEVDLAGYIIYRSFTELDDYVEIGRADEEASSFVDDEVENGVTYYYAVSAYDKEGKESDLSPGIVDDTPRPDGRNVKLEDYILEPDRSGFDFDYPERGAQAFDRRGTDIYFGVDGEVNVPYIYSDDPDLGIQDLGYTDHMDDVDVSPIRGFTRLFVEAIIGHTYAFLTPDGHYAKIRVKDLDIEWTNGDVQEAWFVFDWAFQLQPDNPELAPPRN